MNNLLIVKYIPLIGYVFLNLIFYTFTNKCAGKGIYE